MGFVRTIMASIVVLGAAAVESAGEGNAMPAQPAEPNAPPPTSLIPPPELYRAEELEAPAGPPTWPERIVAQPGQELVVQVPAFAKAESTHPRLAVVHPDPSHGLIRLTMTNSLQAVQATTQPVGVKVQVDKETARQIPIVMRRDLVQDVQTLLKDLPGLKVQQEAGHIVVRGPLLEKKDRARFERVLSLYPGVLDFTTDAIDAPDKMIEIDVIIVVVNDRIVRRIGFDFLQAVQFHFGTYQTYNRRAPIGNLRPAPLDPTLPAPTVLAQSQWGETLSAAIDYNVNIANANDEGSKVIARPHLVTLNGQTAEFHAGGEIAFRLTGVQFVGLEKYERGIILRVTPTLLKPTEPDGKPRVLIDAEVTRISVTDLLLGGAAGDDVDFDKTRVHSRTILEMNQTLTLSGIYQREYRKQNEGVPFLRDVPGLKLFFSRDSTLQDVVSTIVFLTPREPGFVDQANEEATREFVERRREYIEARESGDPERLEKFKEKYPRWMAPQPNRYATHFFLRNESSVYQDLRGIDLRQEEIRSDILDVKGAEEAHRQSRQGSGFLAQ